MSEEDGAESSPDAEDPFAEIEGADVEDDPFAEFDAGKATEADDSAADSLFREVEVSELDDDEVWAQLAQAESASEVADTEPAEEAVDTADVGDRVVEKRAYCEQCEHFSEPPDVACTYPDGEIVELVDTKRFRVRNCPIVARRENSEITAIAGGDTDDSELEPGDPTAPADSESGD